MTVPCLETGPIEQTAAHDQSPGASLPALGPPVDNDWQSLINWSPCAASPQLLQHMANSPSQGLLAHRLNTLPRVFEASWHRCKPAVRSKRTPFKTASIRAETSLTLTLNSCVRCRFARKRVSDSI